MRQLRIFLTIGFLSVLLFNSCKKETEGLSTETLHAYMNGDAVQYLAPGVYVEEGLSYKGVKLPEDAYEQEGSVNPDSAGIYEITYTYVNADGYTRRMQRKVYIFDPTAKIPSGVYKSEFKNLDLFVIATGPDTYYIESIEGLYACSVQTDPVGFKNVYGNGLYIPGIVKLNDDNTFSLVWTDPEGMWAYGALPYYSSIEIDGSIYNEATGVLTFATVITRPNGSVLKREFELTLDTAWK